MPIFRFTTTILNIDGEQTVRYRDALLPEHFDRNFYIEKLEEEYWSNDVYVITTKFEELDYGR